jgi:hypothetical protein
MTDYKVDDTVWFIPDGYLIAIECKIIEVDDELRKHAPESYLFYDLDEPVGHCVTNDELYITKELVLEELKFRYEEALNEIFENDKDKLVITLNEYRTRRINFIVNTWEDCVDHEKSFIKKSWYLKLPSKEYGKEWFNINNF